MNVFHMLAICLISLFSGIACADSFDEASKLFERYAALEAAFDPAVADLYADDAILRNKRTYPTGQVREQSMQGVQYKELLRKTMPLAKMKGDYSTYFSAKFTKENTGVRITAMRFSVLKKYSSPISLLVSPEKSGRWVIREELSESQPF